MLYHKSTSSINSVVQIFAGKYFNDNVSGMVASEDAAFVLSYAIMMLNTDLHSPQVRHHMTTNEWIKMNKGVRKGWVYRSPHVRVFAWAVYCMGVHVYIYFCHRKQQW